MAHAWTNLFTARGEFEHFDTKSPTTSLLNELETGQTRRFDSDRSNLHCLRIPDGVTVLCHRPICPGRIFPALPTRDHTQNGTKKPATSLLTVSEACHCCFFANLRNWIGNENVLWTLYLGVGRLVLLLLERFACGFVCRRQRQTLFSL